MPVTIETHIFIISWKGQHENASKIAHALAGSTRKVTIVYSDPDENVSPAGNFHTLRRPDELFFGDKFSACLTAFNSDVFILIHADCSTNDWRQLVEKCEKTLTENSLVGVWAPEIDYTGFDLKRTWIADTTIPEMKIVSHTDSIVFGLRSTIINRLKKADYRKNIHGWGIGSMAMAFAYTNKMYAVVDRSINVFHPQPRGYSSHDAGLQRDEFLKQLSTAELIQSRLLNSHMSLRNAKLNENMGS